MSKAQLTSWGSNFIFALPEPPNKQKSTGKVTINSIHLSDLTNCPLLMSDIRIHKHKTSVTITQNFSTFVPFYQKMLCYQ